MLGLFGALGIFRSLLEFVGKGDPIKGTQGLIAGSVYLAVIPSSGRESVAEALRNQYKRRADWPAS